MRWSRLFAPVVVSAAVGSTVTQLPKEWQYGMCAGLIAGLVFLLAWKNCCGLAQSQKMQCTFKSRSVWTSSKPNFRKFWVGRSNGEALPVAAADCRSLNPTAHQRHQTNPIP